MYSLGKRLSFVKFGAILMVLMQSGANAGPMKRLSRMVREVYPEIEPENEGNQAQVCIVGDVVYGMDEAVPAEQPCLKCRCQPPGVQCETIQCVKKPGCKAIHKPNKCCPEYQCECEHHGKFYANGQKLETPPGGECKVCYCRGGEVQCAEVSCYIRKDCEGKRVPGTCCPKYDHCPPIDPVAARSSFTTEVTLTNLDKDNFETWPSTGLKANVTEVVSNPSADVQDENKIPDTSDYELTTSSIKATETDDLQKDHVALPRITIQEIIPERKENPITAPPKVDNELHGTLIIEEADEFLNHSNDLVVTDSDADSSEISEVFQQPPPVLRIGDKLLFLKKDELVPEKDTSTSSSVITIIGAEGLQRGYEESIEIHETKIENGTKDIQVILNNTDIERPQGDSTYPTLLDSSKDINDLELNTAASTHILSLVKRKNKSPSTEAPLSSTTVKLAEVENQPLVPSPTESLASQETMETTSSPVSSFITTAKSQEPANESVITEGIQASTTISPELPTEEIILTEIPITETESSTLAEKIETTTQMVKHLEANPTEQNPAYPPIPEIMSPNMDDTSQRFDTENSEKEVDTTTKPLSYKILPEVLEIRNNKTVPENVTNIEWLKTNPETLINYKATLPDELLKQPSLTDLESTTIITSDETNSTEVVTSETILTTLTSEVETETMEPSTDRPITKEAFVLDDIAVDLTTPVAETQKSAESLEDSSEESRESTTSKESHASLIENASIEVKDSEESTEADDMIAEKENSEPLTAGKIIDEVNDKKNQTNELKLNDVEIIKDVKILERKPEIGKEIAAQTDQLPESTVTPEPLPKPEKLLNLPSKAIFKRENSPGDELDDVFEDLDKELNADTTDSNLTSEEEDREADDIFRELLEETSTSRSTNAKPQSREAAALQRVSDALAQITLRGKQPDTNILGVLTNFFSSQYQNYDKK